MKKYNIQNYIRYKKEIDKLSRKLENKDWSGCDREELRKEIKLLNKQNEEI